MNSFKSLKMNFGILHWQYQPTQLYLRVGFSLPTQVTFFLICADDSAGTGYCPHIMPRPGLFLLS